MIGCSIFNFFCINKICSLSNKTIGITIKMYFNLDVKQSTDLSIAVQIITGVAGLAGLAFALDKKHEILREILNVELGVQAVELAFYIFVLRKTVATDLEGMAAVRYFDWFITTPTMLLTTIVYFKYEEMMETERQNPGVEVPPLELGQFIHDNAKNIAIILACNFLMLLFGYLGERGMGDKWVMGGAGFVFFFAAFYVIYTEYAVKTPIGKNLYAVLFIVWALYGVAYGFGDVVKNNAYNGLDIVAKNFFGVFLSAKIYSLRAA